RSQVDRVRTLAGRGKMRAVPPPGSRAALREVGRVSVRRSHLARNDPDRGGPAPGAQPPTPARPRRARVRATALVLALATASPATALDVKVWPLFRYARDDAHGVVRWSAVGPLIEFTRTPEIRDLRIRPFLSLH